MATSISQTTTCDRYRKKTEGCKLCCDIKSNRKTLPLTEKKLIFLDVPVEIINKTITETPLKKAARKQNREEFTNELGICVSALHNSKGGAVLVHINGLHTKDNFLDSFHELVDEKLNLMKEDGTLFIDSYKKYWLSDHKSPTTACYRGFVVIKVSPALKVVTADFKTKVPLDNKVLNPSAVELESFLQSLDDSLESVQQKPLVRVGSAVTTGECRLIQFKSTRGDSLPKTPKKQAEYIWNKLNLKYYISSFSKNEEGGSFILGVAEDSRLYASYESRIYTKEGFSLGKSDQSSLKEEILRRAQEDLSVYLLNPERSFVNLQESDTVENHIKISDIIKVVFHPIERSNKVVLEVAVASINGLVFYDSSGPESYQVDDKGEVKKKHFSDWLECLLGSISDQSTSA